MTGELFTARGAEALAAAAGEADLDSLAVVQRMRDAFGGELGAAALTQESLRRKAIEKFGERAKGLFLTRDGLEMASRADVARWRAERFVAAGVEEVWDLGCGIGADSLAFRDVGLRVTGVELDPVTARFAEANIGAPVVVGDAECVAIPDGVGVFLDPARRDDRGRVWSTAGLAPSWGFTVATLREHPGCAKVAPGIAHRDLPEGLGAEWVSHRGDVVECSLWSLGEPVMAATLLPSGERLVRDDSPPPAVVGVRAYVGEADGAATRAACLPRLARELEAGLVDSHAGYLAADEATESPWVTWFEVLESLPYKEKGLRRWVADHGVATLEIKVRGLDVDPAQLRRALKPGRAKSAAPGSGGRDAAAATLVLTPTPDGARALVCRRLP